MIPLIVLVLAVGVIILARRAVGDAVELQRSRAELRVAQLRPADAFGAVGDGEALLRRGHAVGAR